MSADTINGSTPRRVLQVLDVNQQTPSNAMPKKTPKQRKSLSSSRTSISSLSKAARSNPMTPKEKFDEVHDLRVAEGLTDELADMGVKEWSVDDFEFVSKMGSGASATVYRAKEIISGYHVALKVQEYDEGEVSSMADVELDIHCDLDHPNIVRMIDYFFDDIPFDEDDVLESDDNEGMADKRYFYMILELCDKGSLFDVVDSSEGGWLDECDAVGYFRGCLEAVKYLHEKGLIHSDVKTANFLVDQNDKVKLADFGLTVRSNELEEVLGGSPVFMAPEHLHAWRAGGNDFDYRVDIYGLGVTLFQMLVGDFPFYIIENDDDHHAADSLEAAFGKLTVGEGLDGFDPYRLDLRSLNDFSSEDGFTLPPITFPDFMSAEARDLISRLMECDREKRISLSEALDHAWFTYHS